jgi:hypothetical protein
VIDDGGIALQRSAAVAWSVGVTYTGGVIRTAPVRLNYIGLYCRRFDIDGALPSGLVVKAEPRDWVDDAWVAHEWAAGADYSQLQFPKSELFEYEYRFLSESGKGEITQDSREEEGEDVGGSTIAKNDAQVMFLCQPLTAGVMGDPIWGPFMSLVHEATLNVNDPLDAATRPSLWTGGAGVTVDPANNDNWTAAAGTVSPTVTRDLTNRYEMRMDWLANHPETMNYHNPDAPYILRRNRAGETYLTFGDNPDWWDSDAGGCDEEDVWNWAEYAYLAVGIVAPRAGTVELELSYKVPHVTDPCNTDFGCRYGGDNPPGFTISYAEGTLTYRFAVEAGANAILVDLCLPREKLIPEGEHRLCVVKTLQWTLPTAGGSDEEWELTLLNLTEDEAPASTVLTHNKRAWDWPSECWFGFGALVDGKPALQVDPGYRHLREEWGLQYIQLAANCALQDPPPDQDPTYAKDLSRIYTEATLCEGWTGTWGAPVNAAGNQDADQICFAPAMYWWDLEHQHEDSVSGAVCVGTFKWAYGAEYDLYYTVYPRGKICGIATDPGWMARKRSEAGLVQLWRKPTGGDWEWVAAIGTDAEGWYNSGPLLEKGYTYKVAGSDEVGVANREFTFLRAIIASGVRRQIGMNCDPGVGTPGYAWPDANGYLWFNQIVDGVNVPGTAVLVDDNREYSGGSYDRQAGVLYVIGLGAADGLPYLFTSRDGGATWTAEGAVG